jgi:3-oxoacyl-[acyl-carrier protein] reductase
MNKVAVVTGAARGIGAQIAIRLAADGFDLAVLDLEEANCQATAAAVEELGRRAIAVAVDVTDESSVSAAVQRVAQELGPPLVLVNNAGIMRSRMMHRMSLSEWDVVMDVNLRGAFLMRR